MLPMTELASGAASLNINLNSRQLEQFSVYYRVLTEWNRKLNLTTVSDYFKVQQIHFLDSLTVSLALPTENELINRKIIDIGSGPGFPGVPMKILYPEMKITLLEANSKKTVFLKNLMEQLNLKYVEVVNRRSEELAHCTEYREQYDFVLVRAVAKLPVLAELALPLLKKNGNLISQKKGDINEEITISTRAVNIMGGRIKEIKNIELPELDDDRKLVVIEKITTTPDNYPRRPGMPSKRPIL